jgi:hypothetical protein
MTKLAFFAVAASMLSLVATSASAQERAAELKVRTTCDGGTQISVLTNTENASFNLNAAGVVPSTTISFGATSAATSDAYTVTFSGEAGHTSGGSWTAQAQVSVNGGAFVNMSPVGPDTFHSGSLTQTHTMTWCNRITAVRTVFRIVYTEAGAGVGVIDDFTTRVERSQ